MMRLFDMTGRYAALAARIDQGEEVDEAELALLEDAIEHKSAAIVHLVRELELDIDKLDDELKRLAARKKTAQNNRERLRRYIETCMQQAGASKLKAATFSVSLSDGPECVVVDDEAAVPEEFLRIKREVNKSAILAAYKAHGELVPGVHIERGTRLVIR
jgi:phage host-nuclease inhibitor protein Gam